MSAARTAAYQAVADRFGIGWRTVRRAVLDAEKRAAVLAAEPQGRHAGDIDE